MTSGGSITFVRAAGTPVDWNFFEEPDPSYPLKDVTCVSAKGTAVINNPGAATNQANPVRIVSLPEGDTVTCTFINSPEATGQRPDRCRQGDHQRCGHLPDHG